MYSYGRCTELAGCWIRENSKQTALGGGYDKGADQYLGGDIMSVDSRLRLLLYSITFTVRVADFVFKKSSTWFRRDAREEQNGSHLGDSQNIFCCNKVREK